MIKQLWRQRRKLKQQDVLGQASDLMVGCKLRKEVSSSMTLPESNLPRKDQAQDPSSTHRTHKEHLTSPDQRHQIIMVVVASGID